MKAALYALLNMYQGQPVWISPFFILSRLWKVKVQFQLQCSTTGTRKNSAGCIFTTATELNIWLNILDVNTHAVPGCNPACLCM